jgi:hypothetical protein
MTARDPSSRAFWTPEQRAAHSQRMRRVARRRREEDSPIASEIERCRDNGLVTEWLRPTPTAAREETLGLV